MWERIGELLAVNFSWVIAVLVAMIGVGLMGALGESASADKSPVALPPGAESAKVAALLKDFPGGDQAPVILVATRSDGGDLSPADLGAAEAARARMLTIAGSAGGPAIPVVPSTDGKAALAPVPLDSTLTGFALSDKVKALREAARDGLPSDLVVNVTGGPAFGADIANAFSGANVTLLAVTGAVVALLLIVTYRSPVLWLVPLLVIAFADRVAAVLGSGIAEATGMTADGSTSGITSVLVFGAGTNYALLLISRYREELRRTSHHRQALQTAVRHAGPAIVASNATVVLALLTLLFASSPSTRSLGVQA
ncbi:MAG: MMPL family transporter, partial [Mycobacterium sp.]|nr:MMPL family transporter [Mycobacterium sp.]